MNRTMSLVLVLVLGWSSLALAQDAQTQQVIAECKARYGEDTQLIIACVQDYNTRVLGRQVSEMTSEMKQEIERLRAEVEATKQMAQDKRELTPEPLYDGKVGNNEDFVDEEDEFPSVLPKREFVTKPAYVETESNTDQVLTRLQQNFGKSSASSQAVPSSPPQAPSAPAPQTYELPNSQPAPLPTQPPLTRPVTLPRPPGMQLQQGPQVLLPQTNYQVMQTAGSSAAAAFPLGGDRYRLNMLASAAGKWKRGSTQVRVLVKKNGEYLRIAQNGDSAPWGEIYADLNRDGDADRRNPNYSAVDPFTVDAVEIAMVGKNDDIELVYLSPIAKTLIHVQAPPQILWGDPVYIRAPPLQRMGEWIESARSGVRIAR